MIREEEQNLKYHLPSGEFFSSSHISQPGLKKAQNPQVGIVVWTESSRCSPQVLSGRVEKRSPNTQREWGKFLIFTFCPTFLYLLKFQPVGVAARVGEHRHLALWGVLSSLFDWKICSPRRMGWNLFHFLYSATWPWTVTATAGNTQQGRLNKVPGYCEEEGALESDPIKLSMNYWAHP